MTEVSVTACQRDPQLWFSEHPAELERAKGTLPALSTARG